MSKSDRILNLFPAIYASSDRTKLLYEVVQLLSAPLEEADTHLFRIQRSHRLKVAEHVDDIIRLAAVLNLSKIHFEDILDDKALDYNQKVILMRDRVLRIVRIHLKGLGTSDAIIESAAIFLNAEIVPEHPGDPLIKHLDNELFSHKAVVEFIHFAKKRRERIYLHENPYRRKKVKPSERWPMSSWMIENKNFVPSQLRLVIQGVSDHTVLPVIFCRETGEGILFNGIIPGGMTLIVDESDGAMMDNQPVDKWIIYFKGGIFDFSRSDDADFVIQQDDSPFPFDGDLKKIASHPYRKKKSVPNIPVGQSEWHFNVAEGIYDGNVFDYSVYVTNREAIGVYDEDFVFDECVFDFRASGFVGMAWDERIPCTFKLLLPPNIPESQNQGEDSVTNSAEERNSAELPENYLSRIGNILTRFKAAGIRAFVDTAKDSWILGESVIRHPAASGGEGVAFHATNLQAHKSDILVPFDVKS